MQSSRSASAPLRNRLRERLANARSSTTGEAWLAGLPPELSASFNHLMPVAPIPAAVLVPIVDHGAGLTVLLTERAADLKNHAGQISFPGGRVDEGDLDRVYTALREAEEETGLARDAVQVIGTLPDYDIPTGFRVTPVVGWIEPPVEYDPDPFEVAEVFEVPLAHFLDPANHQRHSDEVNGRRRNYYAMPYQQRNIWGATAGMLYSLYQVLRG